MFKGERFPAIITPCCTFFVGPLSVSGHAGILLCIPCYHPLPPLLPSLASFVAHLNPLFSSPQVLCCPLLLTSGWLANNSIVDQSARIQRGVKQQIGFLWRSSPSGNQLVMTEDTILSIESSDQGENIVISNARVQHNGRRLLIRAQRGRRKRPWIGPSVIDWWVITNWNNVLTYPALLNTTCPMLVIIEGYKPHST